MLVDKGRRRFVRSASHICCRGWSFMAELEGGDEFSMEDRQPTFVQELDDAMMLVKEDVCEWLTRIFALSDDQAVEPHNFLDRLDDGVLACRLVKMIDDAAGPDDKKLRPPRCKANATAGSWFARDNISNFLVWCRKIGIRDELLFETEGLVMHSEEKNLILTLLELARIAANRNLDIPKFIRMERDIEREQAETTKVDEFDGLVEKVSVQEKRPKTSEAARSPLNNKEIRFNPEVEVSNIPCNDDNNNAAPPTNAEKCEKKSEEKSEKEEEKPVKMAEPEPEVSGTPLVPSSAVDVHVHELAAGCKCQTPFLIERLREGTYKLNGKMCFLRLFKDNVMVRVGGGWLTLSQYLYRHDPCRIVSVTQAGRPKYMVAKSRYRSAKPGQRRMSTDY